MAAVYFFVWLSTLYVIHRAVHQIPILKNIHWDHHQYVESFTGNNWHWSNLFLFNDNWISTLDLWMTEVLPTIIFCAVTNTWWIFIFYYLWAALIQEILEHNPKIDLYPFLTSGKWHLEHHKNSQYNFGLLTPIFDIIMLSNKVPENR